jgi:hypothetical protein
MIFTICVLTRDGVVSARHKDIYRRIAVSCIHHNSKYYWIKMEWHVHAMFPEDELISVAA